MLQSTNSNSLDPFDSLDFAPEKTVLPWLQVLNAEDPERSGLFLTLENCKNADIIVPDSWKPFRARFKRGELDRATGKFVPNSTDGYIFTEARFFVIRQGTLSMFAKRTANTSETYIGDFDHKIYREQKNNLILKIKYLVYLLSKDNQLLHQKPIQFTGRGVFGATFSEHLRAFHKELQTAYGKQRSQKFLMFGVFAIKTASELRGVSPEHSGDSIPYPT